MATSKNSNNKGKNVKTSNVENPQTPIVETPAVADVNIAGLENATAPLSKHVATDAPQFDDIEWLKTANPADYHIDVNTSSKYDKEREDRTQAGLFDLATIQIDGIEINPLLILLGKWWEVKPARTAVKKLIDAEAAVKGYTSDVYLQIELGKQVERFDNIQSAIDRVKYARTYFKPRKPLSNTVLTQPIRINDEVYIVSIQELAKAKETYKGDLEGLRKHIISISQKQTIEIDEL